MKVMRMEKWLEEMPTWMKCYNKQFIQEQEVRYAIKCTKKCFFYFFIFLAKAQQVY